MSNKFMELYDEIIREQENSYNKKKRILQSKHRNQILQLNKRDYREMLDLKDKQKLRRAELQSKLRDKLLELTKKDYHETLELREKQSRRRAAMMERHRQQLKKLNERRF